MVMYHSVRLSRSLMNHQPANCTNSQGERVEVPLELFTPSESYQSILEPPPPYGRLLDGSVINDDIVKVELGELQHIKPLQ